MSDDMNWQAQIERMVAAAALIVVMPSHHEGTLWDLRLLRERNYLAKTIFLAPPTEGGYFKSWLPGAAEDWEQTVAACREAGYALPAPQGNGALFKVDAAGNALNLTPFPRPDPVAWMKAIQTLIDSV